MRKRVYIETTIPSLYYTRRRDVESEARSRWTRQWWEEQSGACTLLSSAVTLVELRRGTSDAVEERVALLAGAELLPITEDVERLAQIYVDQRVMPSDPQGDALHLAVASYHRVDVLLTWNCLHLANANKLDRIRLLNFEIGLPTPTLTTPLNLLAGGEE